MNRMLDKFVFALYLLPFVFIAMFADWHGHINFVLFLLILAIAVATHFMWYGAPRWILFGNVVTFMMSLIFVVIFLPNNEVGSYFKPFGTIGSLAVLSVLFCMFQYVMAWVICKLINTFGKQ